MDAYCLDALTFVLYTYSFCHLWRISLKWLSGRRAKSMMMPCPWWYIRIDTAHIFTHINVLCTVAPGSQPSLELSLHIRMDKRKSSYVCSWHLPWQAPVRMLGMKPRRQGWGWAGHISHGWPQARPMVAQHMVLVQTIPLSCPWHIWLFTWLKQGPVR